MSASNDIALISTITSFNHGATSGVNLGGLSQIDADSLDMVAGCNLLPTVAELAVDNDARLQAGRNIDLGIVTQSHSEAYVYDKRNNSTVRTASEIDTAIAAGGDVALIAGQDVNVKATELTAGGQRQRDRRGRRARVSRNGESSASAGGNRGQADCGSYGIRCQRRGGASRVACHRRLRRGSEWRCKLRGRRIGRGREFSVGDTACEHRGRDDLSVQEKDARSNPMQSIVAGTAAGLSMDAATELANNALSSGELKSFAAAASTLPCTGRLR